MSSEDWEEIPGYDCPAFLRVKETRIPLCNSCEAFGTEDLSSFYVALDGAGGISLICAGCVQQAEVRPAYRIVRAPTEDLGY